jgi:hypothetical protein
MRGFLLIGTKTQICQIYKDKNHLLPVIKWVLKRDGWSEYFFWKTYLILYIYEIRIQKSLVQMGEFYKYIQSENSTPKQDKNTNKSEKTNTQKITPTRIQNRHTNFKNKEHPNTSTTTRFDSL